MPDTILELIQGAVRTYRNIYFPLFKVIFCIKYFNYSLIRCLVFVLDGGNTALGLNVFAGTYAVISFSNSTSVIGVANCEKQVIGLENCEKL